MRERTAVKKESGVLCLERIANHCRGAAGISDRMRSACETVSACKPILPQQRSQAEKDAI